MPTGAILELMDLVAGRVAFSHADGIVATVSVDRVDLLVPLCHMDLVRVEGEIVSVGASSMIVAVKVLKHDIQTRKFVHAAFSFITMVALNPDLKPKKDVPKLDLPDDETARSDALAQRRKQLAEEWVQMQREVDDQSEKLSTVTVEEDTNKEKREFLTIPETEVIVRKQSLPRHLNHNNTIFGGDILKWMEQTATYAARRFTGNSHVLTISMNRVSFKHPLTHRDVVDMRAYVVYVRTYVLEVEVLAYLDRIDAQINSHVGHFTILNLDPLGFKRPIVVGIRLRDEDPEQLKRYEKAKRRFHFNRKEEATQTRSRGEGEFRTFWLSA
mmetsp:Transcript_11402/g.23088  ORF Transcript_11402/g.23088 Transcript_11402/m.23088 type:complete len:328 (+) Transcript_11402:401-1384(+)